MKYSQNDIKLIDISDELLSPEQKTKDDLLCASALQINVKKLVVDSSLIDLWCLDRKEGVLYVSENLYDRAIYLLTLPLPDVERNFMIERKVHQKADSEVTSSKE